jgi:hypothetical protein
MVQVHLFSFPLQCTMWIVLGFEGIAKIRQAHEPDCAVKADFIFHGKRNPARVRHPAMSLNKLVSNEDITDRAGEWDIDVSPKVNVPHFGLLESKLSGSKPMRRYRNVRPSRDPRFEPFRQRSHNDLQFQFFTF